MLKKLLRKILKIRWSYNICVHWSYIDINIGNWLNRYKQWYHKYLIKKYMWVCNNKLIYLRHLNTVFVIQFSFYSKIENEHYCCSVVENNTFNRQLSNLEIFKIKQWKGRPWFNLCYNHFQSYCKFYKQNVKTFYFRENVFKSKMRRSHLSNNQIKLDVVVKLSSNKNIKTWWKGKHIFRNRR